MNLKSLIACSLLLLGWATRAFALAGNLDSPGLAFPGDYPQGDRTNIMAVLRRADSKFLGGEFVNWSTTLRYGGDTKALNQFLEQLARCQHPTISIRFAGLTSK